MCAAEVNPLSVPTYGDNVTQVNSLVASITGTVLLAEDGGLVAPAASVTAVKIRWDGFVDGGYTIQLQPAVAVLVRTVKPRIFHQSKSFCIHIIL